MGDTKDFRKSIFYDFMTSTKLKCSNYLQRSRVVRVILKACDIILFQFKFLDLTRFNGSGQDIKQCTHYGYTNHYVSADNISSIPVDQVLISKTEYNSILQHVNTSSSSLIASNNACLHSSFDPSWVIDSGASDHMTGNSSFLSHISSPCSPSFVTVANGTKTDVQGKGTVTTSDLILSDALYLPQFPFNLLYVHKLTLALNCSVTFYPLIVNLRI